MTTETTAPSYNGFRFPQEIIAHAVWLSFRCHLSQRDVEELLAERGVIVTYESVYQWCLKFGQTYANALRRRRPKPGAKRFLSAFGPLRDHFCSRRHRLQAADYRRERVSRFQVWNAVIGLHMAA